MYHVAISTPPLVGDCMSSVTPSVSFLSSSLPLTHPVLVGAHEIDSEAARVLVPVRAPALGAVAADLANAARESLHSGCGTVDGDSLAGPDRGEAGGLVSAVVPVGLAAAHKVGGPDAAQTRGPASTVASPPAVAARETGVLARSLRAAHFARLARCLYPHAAAGLAGRGAQTDTWR